MDFFLPETLVYGVKTQLFKVFVSPPCTAAPTGVDFGLAALSLLLKSRFSKLVALDRAWRNSDPAAVSREKAAAAVCRALLANASTVSGQIEESIAFITFQVPKRSTASNERAMAL